MLGYAQSLFFGDNLPREILGVGSDPKAHNCFIAFCPVRKKLRKACSLINAADQYAGSERIKSARMACLLGLQDSLHPSHHLGRRHIRWFIYYYNSVHPTFTI
jgi:hypothetical protein